jgi:hypothetical protein
MMGMTVSASDDYDEVGSMAPRRRTNTSQTNATASMPNLRRSASPIASIEADSDQPRVFIRVSRTVDVYNRQAISSQHFGENPWIVVLSFAKPV